MSSARLRPKNSTQQQIQDELAYMPLQGISPTEEGCINPVSPARNVEYATLDMRTRLWEVERNDVKLDKIIGRVAFDQVAKGTAKKFLLRSGATIVAIKMVKGQFLVPDCFSLRTGYKRFLKISTQSIIDFKIVRYFAVMFPLFLPVSIY